MHTYLFLIPCHVYCHEAGYFHRVSNFVLLMVNHVEITKFSTYEYYNFAISHVHA